MRHRGLFFAVIALVAAGTAEASGGVARPRVQRLPRAICSIRWVGFTPDLAAFSSSGTVAATGSCVSGHRSVPPKWSYSYSVIRPSGEACSGGAVSGSGQRFVVTQLGADHLVVTFKLTSSAPGHPAVMTRTLQLLHTPGPRSSGCASLALPELAALNGSRVSLTFDPRQLSPGSHIEVGTVADHCSWDPPNVLHGSTNLRGSNDNPSFVLVGQVPAGWSFVSLGALGNFYEDADIGLTGGNPGWIQAFFALNSPQHPGIKIKATSARPPSCSAALALEATSDGPAVPVTFGVSASDFNASSDGVGCGYATLVNGGSTAGLSLSITDVRPYFPSRYRITCVDGKLVAR